jgi:protein-ribulosamine 3-kinase
MIPDTQVDPAILRALSLSASTSKITPHGGSGFSSTFRLTSTSPSTTLPQTFFIKTSSNPSASTMFQGEHTSLNAIHTVVPSLCPRSFAWGQLDREPNSYFLATEFADMKTSHDHQPSKTSSSSSSSGMTLAQKLAKLHTTPAPLPTTIDPSTATPRFGFPVPTCCGNTPQPNAFTSSWPDFFAQHRLCFILERGERRNGGADAELRRLVSSTVEIVVPRLLGHDHLGGAHGIVPVVVHGDLWAGNRAVAVFSGRRRGEASITRSEAQSASSSSSPEARSRSLSQLDAGDTDNTDNNSSSSSSSSDPTPPSATPEEIIYDPSCTYAHAEYELGIMRMFGGFSAAFMRDYHRLVPKTEPVEEYDDRVSLYESYHHLNHWAIFGAGYRDGAVAILARLVAKYGGGGGG